MIAFQGCQSSKPEILSPTPSLLIQEKSTGESAAPIPASFENGGVTAGNGEGYEGKITYLAKDPVLCGAENVISKKIVKDKNRYFLTRENCSDIAPQEVAESTISLAKTSSQLLISGNDIFENIKHDVPNADIASPGFQNPRDSFIFAVCHAKITKYGPPYGFIDGVIRVILNAKGNRFIQGEFYSLVPDIDRALLEKQQVTGIIPMIENTYFGYMRAQDRMWTDSNNALRFFMTKLILGPKESTLDPTYFNLNLFREPVMKEILYNGAMRIPNNSQEGYFWHNTNCQKLSDTAIL